MILFRSWLLGCALILCVWRVAAEKNERHDDDIGSYLIGTGIHDM